MVVGILQVELLISEARSLKDKRRVLRSIKDRLGRRLEVAIAEVDRADHHQIAVLGIVSVANSGEQVRRVLDGIVEQLRQATHYTLSDHRTEILNGVSG